MKKFFSLLIIAACLFTTTAAFAAFKEDITEDANISAVKRLAVALPMHYKTEDAEPTRDELTQIMFEAGNVARCYVIPYEEIAANIRKETGVDITVLSDAEARKVYGEHVKKYADAFVTVTTANNIKKVQFFFEIQNAQDGNLMYVLTTQSGDIKKDAKGYKKACEDFYKKFDAAVEKSIKDAEKKSKDAEKKNKKK